MRVISVLVGVVIFAFIGDGAWKNFSTVQQGVSIIRTTFANSQKDTITFARQGEIGALAFGFHVKDTMSISEVYVRRLIGSEFTSDSTRLSGAITNTGTTPGFQGTQANPSYSASYSVTITPYCDTYVFIVVYAASANGVTNPSVDYFLNAQLYR